MVIKITLYTDSSMSKVGVKDFLDIDFTPLYADELIQLGVVLNLYYSSLNNQKHTRFEKCCTT